MDAIIDTQDPIADLFAPESQSAPPLRTEVSENAVAVLLIGGSEVFAEQLEISLFIQGITMVRADSLGAVFDLLDGGDDETGRSRWHLAPSCFVCDLENDRAFGLDAVRVLASHRAVQDVPIVAVSNDPDARIAALETGATAGIAAKVSIDAIAAQITAMTRAGDRISDERPQVANEDVPAISGTFFDGTSLETLLTVLGMEGRSGILEVSGDEAVHVDVIEGRAGAAEIAGRRVTPVEAILSALSAGDAFAFTSMPLVAEIADAARLDAVVLDALRIRDEFQARRAS